MLEIVIAGLTQHTIDRDVLLGGQAADGFCYCVRRPQYPDRGKVGTTLVPRNAVIVDEINPGLAPVSWTRGYAAC